MTASQADRSDAADPGEDARGPSPRAPRPPGTRRSEAGADDPTPLAAEVEDVLKDVAAALQKQMMYPDDHPARGAGIRQVVRNLEGLLETRGHLSIRSRKDRLWVDGRASDPDHPLLRSLARRLHEHHVLSLGLREGLGEAELERLLDLLGRETETSGGPLGLASRKVQDLLPHVQIEPLRYDPLEVGERGEDRDAGDVWLTDVEARFSTALGGSNLVTKSPEHVASSIDAEVGEDEYRDRMLASQIFRLAEQLSQAQGRDAARLRKRLSRVILALEPGTMSELLEAGTESGRGDKFLVDAADAMDADAVAELIQAAAERRDEHVPPTLLRMMSKLARYTETGPTPDRPGEEGAVRNLVQGMVEGWRRETASPSTYGSFLEQMSHLHPEVGVTEGDDGGAYDPERMVRMGLELDEPAPAVEEAAERMAASGRAEDLARLLEDVPGSEEVGPRLWTKLAHPGVIRELLHRDPPATEVLEAVARHAGPRMAGPLLEVLALSGSRSVRRTVFELLVQIGEPVLEQVPRWLEHERWFVRRNMLALLEELAAWPKGSRPRQFLRDEDPRVRAEALKAATAVLDEPGKAICEALADDHERVLGLAVAAAERWAPACAEEHLVRHAKDDRLADSVRAGAVRALVRLGTPAGRRTCLDLVWHRRWIFWRRLAAPSPVVEAALGALAAHWPEDPKASDVLAAAAASSEPEHREAVEGSG